MVNQSFDGLLRRMLKPQAGIMLDIFRIISFNNGYKYKMHSHKRIELIYLLKGKCLMKFENELVSLHENNCIFILSNTRHNFFVDSKNGIKIVQLEFRIEDGGKLVEDESLLLNSMQTEIPEIGRKGFIIIPYTPKICNCMERIIVENKIKNTDYEKLLRIYLMELQILLFRQILLEKSGSIDENDLLARAVSKLNASYNTNITIQELADEVSISSRYLRQLFQKQFNKSPVEYLNELRLEKSKELLTNVNYSIKDISFSVGYSSPQYFCRIFKSHFALTPQKYRSYLFDA